MSRWNDDPVLRIEHVTMRFGGLIAVNDLSFNVGRGDITALIGPNGAGKTTVFNCATGFYKPTEGRITMKRRTGEHYLLERMPDFKISAEAGVARTFQNIRLFGGMTLLENLMVAQHNPLMVASGYTVGGLLGIGGFRKAEAGAVDRARYWLERTNLIDRADAPAADLPYGDQRRLEIARAMCTMPELLCLDAPAVHRETAHPRPQGACALACHQVFGRRRGHSVRHLFEPFYRSGANRWPLHSQGAASSQMPSSDGKYWIVRRPQTSR